MKQSSVQKIVSECGKMMFIIDNDTTAASYHDFLLQEKARMIELMIATHQQDEEEIKNIKARESIADESPSPDIAVAV